VALINEALARRLWPGEDPIGKAIRLDDGGPDGDGPDPRRIVGVVKDVRQRDWAAGAMPEMYLAYLQTPSSSLTLVVRTIGDRVAPAIEQAVAAVDPTLPATRARRMEGVVDEALGQPRFNLLLLNVFAGVALLLAALGIYGVMAYAVSRRTREIGVRLALGARAAQVLRLVLRRGLGLTAAGLALGLGAALLVTRLMATLLYEVSATDPLTFGVVSLVLAAAALLACYLPARRATLVDPMVALRQD
jgi:putative ABC transport system permease protein